MSLMEKEMYEFGPFSLDPAERVILQAGKPLSLTPRVFDILLCLVRNHGRLPTRSTLSSKLYRQVTVSPCSNQPVL